MKKKDLDHKKIKTGQMVSVLYRKDWYRGKYYGWAKFEKRHMVRFPVHGPRGLGFQILFVKDGKNLIFRTLMT
jgi:hypothetical protein